MKSASDILKIFFKKSKNIVWFLGLHAFSLILFLVFVDVMLGGFIFYIYVFLPEQENPKATEAVLKFNEKNYQNVLKQLQTREQSNEEIQINAPATGTKSERLNEATEAQ